MAQKNKTVYICSECGYESAKWYGQCPHCGEWNCMEEEIKADSSSKQAYSPVGRANVVTLNEITGSDEIRYDTGIKEFNRVLGGGLVKGSLVLIGGDPGIGKSTILLQSCYNLSKTKKVLYVSGEESSGQIKLRADRLKVNGDNLFVLCDTDAQYVMSLL